jgi:hypothetical protein
MLPFVLDLEAAQEIQNGVLYFDRNPPGRGDAFREAVYEVIEFVRTHPRAGTPYRAPYRKRFVKGFEHTVFYVDYPDHIWVVSVHPARSQPDTWIHRLHPTDPA